LILGLLALSMPAAGGLFAGFWHLLFAPAFTLAL
jgi:hypothetical protein